MHGCQASAPALIEEPVNQRGPDSARLGLGVNRNGHEQPAPARLGFFFRFSKSAQQSWDYGGTPKDGDDRGQREPVPPPGQQSPVEPLRLRRPGNKAPYQALF